MKSHLDTKLGKNQLLELRGTPCCAGHVLLTSEAVLLESFLGRGHASEDDKEHLQGVGECALHRRVVDACGWVTGLR